MACRNVEDAKMLVTRLFGEVWDEGIPINAGPAAFIPKTWSRELSGADIAIVCVKFVFSCEQPASISWPQVVLF